MKIRDILACQDFSLSFEVFPPKRDGNVDTLYRTVRDLETAGPSFISVTYGAGGGTRDTTVAIASKIQNELGAETLAHLTCVQATVQELTDILEELQQNNIENILALRGDPPGGEAAFLRTEGGFGYADELVAFIRSRGGFSIGVAGYPEVHVEAPSAEADLTNLKRKVDAGADFIITQVFFENNAFYRFRDRAVDRGIAVPIIPGLFPIFNARQVPTITKLSNAWIPRDFLARIERSHADPDDTERYGIDFAAGQAEDLIANDAAGLHFCSMNRSRHVLEILSRLTLPGRRSVTQQNG